MSKLYYTFNDCSNGFKNFLSNTCPFLPKTALNIFPHILTGMLSSLSCVTKNIAFACKNQKFDSVQHDSVSRRIRRFFNNDHYDPYQIYDSIIKSVISRYSCKHSDNRIHIIFDHMFKGESFVTFMISLRIGKKSIPLWFRSFACCNSDAFDGALLKQGIQFVSDLFKDKGYKLIFLADRWFGSSSLLNFIDSLGHTYVVRAKSTANVIYFDKSEGHHIKSKTGMLFSYKYKATYYENVLYTNNLFNTNVVISPTKSVSISNKTEDGTVQSPWILLTNGDVKRAIKDYSYRYGAIEFLFKDQKSNCFNLQKTNMRNTHAFAMMYTCLCICYLYLNCLGTYYPKNKHKLYKNLKINYYGLVKGKHTRTKSIFQVGLIMFQEAYASTKYIYLPFTFVLTDI